MMTIINKSDINVNEVIEKLQSVRDMLEDNLSSDKYWNDWLFNYMYLIEEDIDNCKNEKIKEVDIQYTTLTLYNVIDSYMNSLLTVLANRYHDELNKRYGLSLGIKEINVFKNFIRLFSRKQSKCIRMGIDEFMNIIEEIRKQNEQRSIREKQQEKEWESTFSDKTRIKVRLECVLESNRDKSYEYYNIVDYVENVNFWEDKDLKILLERYTLKSVVCELREAFKIYPLSKIIVIKNKKGLTKENIFDKMIMDRDKDRNTLNVEKEIKSIFG